MSDHEDRYQARKKELEGNKIAEIYESQWRQKIEDAKQAGEKKISFTLGQCMGNDGPAPEVRALQEVGKKYLHQMGCPNVQIENSYSPPSTSSDDPYGDHTWHRLVIYL